MFPGGSRAPAWIGDGLSALNHLVQFRPGIVVIDSNLLDEEVDALLVAAKAKQPATRCLVLVRSSSRNEQVLMHGAHAAISRNGSAQELQEALFRLAHDYDRRHIYVSIAVTAVNERN